MKWYWWLAIAVLIGAGWYFWYYEPAQVIEEVTMSKDNKNVEAFLKAIRYAEGTYAANGYTVLYGGSTFTNILEHPYVSGESPGVKLPDAVCKGAGFSPGCKTTAAGAYQFTASTWKRLKARLRLADFSPLSQDLAAIELIREKGALEDVKTGRFSIAVDKVRNIWASMPNSAATNQPEKSIQQLASIYQQNGGTITT